MRMDDPYTMDARLCDDEGMVSHEPVADRKLLEREGTTYLDRLNNWRSVGAHIRGDEHFEAVTEAYRCTGHAHLIGEHMRCISPAHRRPQ